MIESTSRKSARRELKYIIDEGRAAGVRDFLRSYLVEDEFLWRYPERAYPICSLYLDNGSLLLYQQTQEGKKNRFKLRIRFYDDDRTSPAFAEIKRRESTVIIKKRAALSREAAQRVLIGHPPTADMLYSQPGSTRSLAALYEFCRLRDEICATGISYVYYRREAYVSPDSQVRVTFDRQLQGGVYHPASPLALPREIREPQVGGVILELKFTDRFPHWMLDLTQSFNLRATSVPKYVKCVDALGLVDSVRYRPVRQDSHESLA